RIGNYRVVYSIEDQIRVVQVRDVGHRSSIYR
ncbi:MAG: type II toxin-antitoxin system RelE/ParE family toxin, partial [Bacteroidetes bacterium]|nr:type II toxin-antitoxin system RelE/ParE family toxin [Bacteroidota bacterium]